MRTGVGFNAPPPPPTTTIPSLPSPQKHHSPLVSHSAWHSPVPYLFGGLAAMLGLIAFALLILACSYWKLSGYLDGADQGDEDGSVSGGGGGGANSGTIKDSGADVKPAPCFGQVNIVVIMAGDEMPTFLATPISSRASSFGDNGSCSSVDVDGKRVDGDGDGTVRGRKMPVGSGDQGVEWSEAGNLTAERDRERGNDQNSQGQEL